MKNASLLINLVLAIALAVLYFLHFSGQKSTEVAPVENEPVVETEISNEESSSITYYIHTDSLVSKYQLWIDRDAEFAADRKRKEQLFQAKVSEFQQRYQTLQATAATMSEGVQRAQIQQLQMDEQALAEEKNAIDQALFQTEQKVTMEINTAIREYLKKHVEGKNVGYVLMHNDLGNVAFANEGLDITNEVLEGLNEDYAASKLEGETAE